MAYRKNDFTSHTDTTRSLVLMLITCLLLSNDQVLLEQAKPQDNVDPAFC